MATTKRDKRKHTSPPSWRILLTNEEHAAYPQIAEKYGYPKVGEFIRALVDAAERNDPAKSEAIPFRHRYLDQLRAA